MEFTKKVLVLKEIEKGYALPGKKPSGIIRIEIENGTAEFHSSLINVAFKKGEYVAFILDGKRRLYSFGLGKRPSSFSRTFTAVPDVKNGFCAGVCYIENGIPLLVLYSATDDFSCDIADFKKKITDKYIEIRKEEDVEPFPAYPVTPPAVPLPPMPPPNFYPKPGEEPDTEPKVTPPDDFKADEKIYDDEAVATENYFLNDEIKEQNEFIARVTGDVRTENEMPFGGKQDKAKEGESLDNGFPNAPDDDNGEKYSEDRPYIETVRSELNDIFERFPIEERLLSNLPSSKWAKINYSETKYYVVGIISENGKEKYICYGVPAKYSLTPPKELKGYCAFIPLSIFDLKGDGYWMMFQDAVTGECIKKKS